MVFSAMNQAYSRIVTLVVAMSLIMSAFPAAFLVAEAANIDAVGTITASIIADPAAGESESVEISFSGTGTVNLDGWSFTDNASTRYTFGPTDTLTNGQSIVLCGDDGLATVCDGEYTGGASVWANAADTFTLFDETPASVLVVEWTTTVAEGVPETNSVVVDYAPPACTPQVEDGLGAGPVENTSTNQYFTTIQNAIDDCDTVDGHTIVVSTGTYTDAVVIDKELTLEGGTVATIQAPARVEASNVTINEFIFDGGANNPVLLRIPGSNPSLENVVVTNNVFENMDITSNNDSAALTIESSDGTLVEGNTFRNLTTKNGTTNRTMQGILIGDTGQSAAINDVIIRDNTFENIEGARGAYAMIVNRVTTQLQVIGNDISGIVGNADSTGSGWASGIGLDADTPDAVVRNNTVSGVTSLVNDFAGAFGIIGQTPAVAESIVVEYNDFLAVGGVENRTSGDVDFSLNWWGSDEGPKYVDINTPANSDLTPAGMPVVQSVAGGSIETEPWLCGPFASSPDESVGGVCVGDIVKPTIVVDSPVNGIVVGSDFDITVTATDDVALDTVVVNLKTGTGGHIGTCLNESAGGAATHTASCTVDVDALAEGTYQFRTNTRDLAGNISNTINQTFIVDKTRPTIVVNTPVDNLMTSTDFDISVTATDDIGIGQVVIHIKDEFGAHLGSCLNEVANDTTPYTTSCTVSLTDWADGNYQFKTNALDTAGNLSNTITQAFTINTNRPTIVVNDPVGVITTDSDFTISVTATDDTGVAQVVINIKDEFGAHLGTCLNETVGGDTPHTTSCAVDVDALADGTYNFRTNARDINGNLSNTINQEFVVSRVPTTDVTICKYDEQENALSGWQLSLLGDTVTTLSFAPTAAVQSMTAVPAGDYVLKAAGAYKYRGGTDLLADARFSERKAGDAGFGTYPDQPWRITNPQNGGLAVSVNGDDGALWGDVFSPSHVYYGGFTQNVLSDIDFTMYDDGYNDNSGAITLTLHQGFTGVTEEDGCVVFEDVPYGDYEVAELLQAGFENTSGLGPVVVEEEDEMFVVVNNDLSYIPPCELEAVSNAGTVIIENNSFATSSYAHPNWTASIPGATWIWENYYVLDYTTTAVKTFEETFTVVDPTSATLDIAADNGYRVFINDVLVVDRSAESNNFQTHTQKTWTSEILAELVSGENTMRIEVTNNAGGNNAQSNPAGVLYKLVVTAATDCALTTDVAEEVVPETYTLSGYKWDDANANGIWDQGESAIQGWEMYLGVGESFMATTTDATGFYFFEVGAGQWTITEKDVDGWTQTGQAVNGTLVASTSETFGACTFTAPNESGYSCYFGNQEDAEVVTPIVPELQFESTGGGGGSTGTLTRVPAPLARVLGASTSACQLYLNNYLKSGDDNDVFEVIKLQLFLSWSGLTTAITGIFDDGTETSVRSYQAQHSDEILLPWVTAGLTTEAAPTGYVYRTTRWKINDTVCPGITPFPELN